MLASASEYGPFAPLFGYAGAIMSVGTALLFMWAGKMRKWRPPDEDLPGTAKHLVLLLCSICIVILWYFAVPESITWYFAVVVVLAIACVICFFRYSGLIGTYGYTKKVATSSNSTRDELILGGRVLLPKAESEMKRNNIDIQTLLEGAAYKTDSLWSREARQWVKQRVLLSFIFTLVFGTSALAGASFATQMLLTKKPAASVIHTTEAPSLR